MTNPSHQGQVRTSAPLQGLRVLDFSTLLPGPLCGLMLAQAGAEVIKIERPGKGDEMRSYVPKFGVDSVNFALLNQGKRSVTLDLKSSAGLEQSREMVKQADILLEQFRPGVMERLGLGYEALRAINPRLIYCAISGWGQNGPLMNLAAHDVNFQAEAGLLAVTAGNDGEPVLPNLGAADIAGGTYPAMINILLALRTRESSGAGCYIDISMADNLFTFLYWGLGNGFGAGDWPAPRTGLTMGGTPRYQIYRAADGRHLACAPLEEKFWENFLRILQAPQLLDDSKDPDGVRHAIQAIIQTKSADEWIALFQNVDACVSIVKSPKQAVESAQFKARGVFAAQVRAADGSTMPALPTPLIAAFAGYARDTAPGLGEANDELLP